MIQVNLLPPEYRVKDRAPISRMLGLAAGVAIAFGAMGLFLYMKFVLVDGAVQKKKDKTEQRDIAKKQAAKYDELKKKLEARKKREDKIKTIQQDDPKYARLLYDLTRLVWAGEDENEFTAWFKTVKVDEARRSGRQRGQGAAAEITVSAATAGDDGMRVADFYRAVRRHEYVQSQFDLSTINPIKYNREAFADFDPNCALMFEVSITGQTAEAKQKAREEAAKAAAKAAKGAADNGGKNGKTGKSTQPAKAPGKQG